MKNILNGTKAYLAGNMEHTVDSVGWRDYVESQLKEIGVITLSPLKTTFLNQKNETEEDRTKLRNDRHEGKFDSVTDHMRGVVQKDLRLIDLSDFVIINLEINKPTFGTIHELVVATQQKKPIFLSVGSKNLCPLWIFGILKHKYIYNNVDEILSMLYKIDSGTKEIDSSRWRILLSEYR